VVVVVVVLVVAVVRVRTGCMSERRIVIERSTGEFVGCETEVGVQFGSSRYAESWEHQGRFREYDQFSP
jgi:hypothetical protein